MGNLYGNIISHIPRSHFDIKKVFQNRAVMEASLTSTSPDDYVNIYDYVLVDYSNSYNTNEATDKERYGHGCYDKTIWQKGYTNIERRVSETNPDTGIVTVEKKFLETAPTFIAIAKLNSILPTYTDNEVSIPVAFTRLNAIPLVINIPDNQYQQNGNNITVIEEGFNHFGTTEINSSLISLENGSTIVPNSADLEQYKQAQNTLTVAKKNLKDNPYSEINQKAVEDAILAIKELTKNWAPNYPVNELSRYNTETYAYLTK